MSFSAQQLQDVLLMRRVYHVRHFLLEEERERIAATLSDSKQPEDLTDVLRLTATLEANTAEEHQLGFKFIRAYYKGVSPVAYACECAHLQQLTATSCCTSPHLLSDL